MEENEYMEELKTEELKTEDLKENKKVFSKLGLCYLAGTAAVYLITMALGYLAKEEWVDNMTVNLIMSCVAVYGIGMPLIVLLARKIPAKKPETHKMKWWQFLLAFMMCYALTLVANLVGLLITYLIGQIKGSPVQNDLISLVTEGNMLVNFIAMVIVAPAVEEYVFRKVIVDRTARFGQGVAIVTSGLMFGLFHGNLNQFAYAVILGGFFAFIYIKTGKLGITIGLHALINFLGSVAAPLLMKGIDLDKIASASDMGAIMEAVAENPVGWLLYLGYMVVLYAMVFAGLIMFIVFLCLKRFRLEPGEESIPKGKRFSTMILNPGMLIFCAVWIVLIVIQFMS